jgi:hypothetical protein
VTARLLVSAALLAILTLAGSAGSDATAPRESAHASAAHLTSPLPPDPEPAAIVKAAAAAVIVHAAAVPSCSDNRPRADQFLAANPSPTDRRGRSAGPRTFPLLI